MAEPTTALVLNEYQAEVGIFLGWGRGTVYGETAWTTQQLAVIASLLKSGYAQFLQPPRVEHEAASYNWSFARPTASLTLASGASTIALPDDFAGFEGDLTVLSSGSNSQPWRIEWSNEGLIRQRYSVNPTVTGPPAYAAERPIKGTAATAGQRFQLFVFPLADQAYTLQGTYYVNSDALSSSFPYPVGGAQHAETIKASCIAAAELYLDDQRGPRWAYFLERLQASIAVDRRRKDQRIGNNNDRSDARDVYYRPNMHGYGPAATYAGSAFE